jgi:Carboxyl transferase domain
MDEALLSIVPDSARRAYDMKKVIAAIVDRGHVFEIKPAWAKNLITCFARLGGRPVGIVANQPMVLGGALDVDSADKAARFIMLCDAFHIPLVFLQDVPGFMVGSKVEKQGIIRHGAKMLYAVSEATVPKVTVVVRKAYGAGYFVMCGKAYEPDLADGGDLGDGPGGRDQHHLPQGDCGGRQPRRGAREPGRGVPQAHQSLHRRGRRLHRRRDRPARDPPRPYPRPRDGRNQESRPPLEEARSHAGVIPFAA